METIFLRPQLTFSGYNLKPTPERWYRDCLSETAQEAVPTGKSFFERLYLVLGLRKFAL